MWLGSQDHLIADCGPADGTPGKYQVLITLGAVIRGDTPILM